MNKRLSLDKRRAKVILSSLIHYLAIVQNREEMNGDKDIVIECFDILEIIENKFPELKTKYKMNEVNYSGPDNWFSKWTRDEIFEGKDFLDPKKYRFKTDPFRKR